MAIKSSRRKRNSRKKKFFAEIKKWGRREKLAALLFSAIFIVIAASAAFAMPDLFSQRGATVPLCESSSLEAVHIIDVGQGSAALLESNGEFALIDGGTRQYAGELVDYLNSAGVVKLKYLIMTHPHSDHIGGMEAVLRNFETENFILPDFNLAPVPTNSIFESLINYALEKEINSSTAGEGVIYPLGLGNIEVVHGGVESDANLNLISLALRYKSEEMSLLCTGDGEKINEKAMLENPQKLKSDIFIAGHHGSSTSNTENFVLAVLPELCLISCAKGNDYGHPHRSSLNAFSAVGARVLSTADRGCIIIKPDGNGAYAMGSTIEPEETLPKETNIIAA